MTANEGRSTSSCEGWENDGSPEPTCWSGGCERLDREGSCPGWTPPVVTAPARTPSPPESTSGSYETDQEAT